MFPTIVDALTASPQLTFERHSKYVNPKFVPTLKKLALQRIFVRAEGVHVWDAEGRQYLDFNGNFGAVSIGHNHPTLVETVKEYLSRRIPTFCRTAPAVVTSALAEHLANIMPGRLSVTHFCQSGTEAVEGGMKLARAATRRMKFLSTTNCYHGKTFGSLSLMGDNEENRCFAPLLPGCEIVPFAEIEALEQRLRTREFAAFIVEPIQSHGGVHLPPEGYLEGAQQICRKTGTLFFVDEIATGFGRTGKMFACEHWNLEPDIMAFGKGLSGGLLPISAYATTRQLWDKAYGTINKHMLHSSTFGENNIASVVGLATLEIIRSERLVEKAAHLGNYFLSELLRLRRHHRLISDVRGRGLMVGVEFGAPPQGLIDRVSFRILRSTSEKLTAFWIVSCLLNDYNIITAGPLASSSVVRMLPPLSINEFHVQHVVRSFDELCGRLANYRDVLVECGASMVRSAAWS